MAVTKRDTVRAVAYRHRDRLNALKLATGCASCGYDQDATKLQWHHREPSEKFKTLNRMLTYSWQRIMDEVAKCEVLCKGCHEERHYGHNREQRIARAVKVLEKDAPHLLK